MLCTVSLAGSKPMNRLKDVRNMNGKPTTIVTAKHAPMRNAIGMNSARHPAKGERHGREPLRHHAHEGEDLSPHVLRDGDLHHRHDEYVDDRVGKAARPEESACPGEAFHEREDDEQTNETVPPSMNRGERRRGGSSLSR